MWLTKYHRQTLWNEGFSGIFANAGSGSGALQSEDYDGYVYTDGCDMSR